MRPSSAKAKGRTFQQSVVKMLLEHFPTLEPDDARSTSMGAAGEDIQLSPAARRLIPFSIECKSRAKIAVYEWLEQARGQGKGYPIVFAKADRKQPIVILDATTFVRLLCKTTM